MIMATAYYLHDPYGNTASIRAKKDGAYQLTCRDYYGRVWKNPCTPLKRQQERRCPERAQGGKNRVNTLKSESMAQGLKIGKSQSDAGL